MNALAQPFTVHRFTVDDVYDMYAKGVLTAEHGVELIEGQLVDMADDSPEHIDWVSVLGGWLHESLGRRFMIVPGSTLRLDDYNGPKPDWWVFDPSVPTAQVRGPDVLLGLEVSQTSRAKDLGPKADLYARFGVRDYWVADVQARRVHVHRDPGPAGYGWTRTYEAHEPVEALLLPGLTLVVDDLPRIGRG
jgi:Uma2 family endonuclease